MTKNSKKRAILTMGAVAVAALGFLARPAAATDLGVGAAYWDTKDADQALGVMTKLTLGRYVELRGTYFSDVTADTSPEATDFEIKAIPVEAGLAWHFGEDASFNPYIGGGASYIFLDTTEGQIDDEVGWYAVVGGDFGRLSNGLSFNAEAIYRSVDATVEENHHGLPSDFTSKTKLDLSGLGANVGVVWHF
jgi:outer membrane protein W